MSKTYADLLLGPQEPMDTGDAQSSKSSTSSEEFLNRIIVGWLTTPFDVRENIDRSMAQYITELGRSGYNFTSYPIGGTVRGFWQYTGGGNKPPRIDLPDMQLANSFWETYVVGRISPWIDCDSEDEELAKLSEEEILKEFSYISYLGLHTVHIELKRINSPRTAAVINKWIWTKHTLFNFWISLPPTLEKALDYHIAPNKVDLWTVWADFRKQCGNFCGHRFSACLHLSSELPDEYLEPKLVDRWMAESVGAIMIDSDVFTTGRDGQAELSQFYQDIVCRFWASDSLRFIVNQKTDAIRFNNRLREEYGIVLRQAVRNLSYKKKREIDSTDGYLAHTNMDYHDVLQVPLQPLSDNLDSGVYNTFEQDKIKYERYGDAVGFAIKDIMQANPDKESIVVYLLGGGRGPIGKQILEANRNYNKTFRTKNTKLKLKMYVVEKNPNAVVTLNYINVTGWANRATIIESDMRSLPQLARENGYEQPDIIVSELLGSFGDNELSPECLDGVTDFLKPDTICIPQNYQSYVAPFMSLSMHNNVKALLQSHWNKGIASHGRHGPVQVDDYSYFQPYPQGDVNARLDEIYVVYLRQCCLLGEAKKVFYFEHPNFAKTSNERSARIEFVIDRPADVMGFAGYFSMVLYKNVTLSIEPSTASKGMMSWFPAVIPLRNLQRVAENDKVTLFIDRKIDEKGVWYEWCTEIQKPSGEVIKTVLQNENGDSYYMRK